MTAPLVIARSEGRDITLLPRLANRHGLITGATGTGKTVTLQKLAESFAAAGVPVFMADVKGDLSGIGVEGVGSDKLMKRLNAIGIDSFTPVANTTVFWDVFGESGHPVRATVSDMGPLLIGRLLNLNDTQAGVLQIVFRVADDNGLLLLDLKDLRAMVQFVGDNAKEIKTQYGNVSTASIGAIQRGLLSIEEQGADRFFGEPMLDIADLMQTDAQGRGVVNVLAADQLYNNPKLYSTFLLWLLSELFENLPELGDPDQPVLVFFFDEAHLLFRNAPRALLEKIEQVVRLIRSKGVGVYFISQSPGDMPDSVLAQLGNRIQHALRAYTPKEQKALKVAAQSFRSNPELDTLTAITELGVGEALVSTLQDKGIPAPVQRVLVRPPHSRMGMASEAERQALLAQDVNRQRYAQPYDPRSAHEVLLERTAARLKQQEQEELEKRAAKAQEKSTSRSRSRQSSGEAFVKSMARSLGSAAGSSLGRKLFRGILGSLLK